MKVGSGSRLAGQAGEFAAGKQSSILGMLHSRRSLPIVPAKDGHPTESALETLRARGTVTARRQVKRASIALR